MKRIIFGFTLLFSIPLLIWAQGFIPPASAAYISDGAGGWTPATTAATAGAVSFTPPASGLYCFNSTLNQWVPATSACLGGGSGGGGSVGSAGQVQMVGATPGSFSASSVTDNGTTVTSSEDITASHSGSTILTSQTTSSNGAAVVAVAAPGMNSFEFAGFGSGNGTGLAGVIGLFDPTNSNTFVWNTNATDDLYFGTPLSGGNVSGGAGSWARILHTGAATFGSVATGSMLATGNVDGTAPMTITTGTSATLGGTFKSGYTLNQEATAAAGVAYTLPTAAAGLQYCVGNSWNGSAATTGILTVNTSASGQFIIFTDGTLSATGGNVTSAGAAADAACFVGVDATHWQIYVNRGTWSKH